MKRSRIPVVLTIFFLILTLSISGCGKKDDNKVKVLKLAHGLDTTHPVHKAMEFMAQKVAEKSQGKMRIDIYPSEQLGSERECIEQLQIGALAMTKTSTAPMESFVSKMKILSLPYLFRDNEHFWKVLNSEIGEEFMDAGKDKGLKGICFYDAGARSFYTTSKPIKSPQDLQGMKIRVMKSNMAIQMIEAMGGSATPIDWGELYTSLQQGVVDGAENNPPSFQTSNHYDICKYYSLDQHTRPPDIILISTMTWNALTPEQQTILKEAGAESVTFQRELWKKKVEESMKIVKDAGVEIIEPDKKPFRQAVQPMYEKLEPDYKKLVEKIEQVK